MPRCCGRVRVELPDAAVLVLSQYVEESDAYDLLVREQRGRRLPAQGPGDRHRRLYGGRAPVAGSGSALDTAVVAQLLGRRRRDDPLDALIARERDVLGLRTNRVIAEQLVVSERAVEKHVTAIVGKLGLPACDVDQGRVLAVLAYLRRP